MKKIPVGILGATGMVGQNYIRLLSDHPWFTVSFLAASEKSAGKTFSEAVSGRWHVSGDIPSEVRDQLVYTIDDLATAQKKCRFVFSAVDSDIAKIWEEKYAAADIPVVSNASTHRFTPDVPMLIPEINPDHTQIIRSQQKNRGWKKGFMVVKPNCSLQSYITPLYALHKTYGIKNVLLTTLQAVSGAGHPGVSSYDIVDNVIPYIKGEEEKTEREPLKILGKVGKDSIIPASGITISAHCTRVPTIDGHLACVSVSFVKKPSLDEILMTWKKFKSAPQDMKLPFAPAQPIVYREEYDRPQPRLDRNTERGMAVVCGRLRPCNVFDYRFVGLSHNTVRGAAGGGILNAELLYKQGFFD